MVTFKHDTSASLGDSKEEVAHIDYPDDNKGSDDCVDLKAEAMAGQVAEHEITVWQALRTYWRSVLWAMLVSLCIVMEGYDQLLVPNLFAQGAFKEKFGEVVPSTGEKQIPAPWQSGLQQAPLVGAFFGVLITGRLVDRLGYRKTGLMSQAAMIAAVFVTFFAESLTVLLIGEFLCGLPWGAFVVISPAYASEVAPLRLRSLLTIYVQVCWIIGGLTVAGVMYAVKDLNNKWGYKIPFALQWFWTIPITIGFFFAPESPWWLVRKGRLTEAERSVRRLGGVHSKQTPNEAVALMVVTNEIEQRERAGTSYLDCFKGTDLRRTLICCGIHFGNVTSGLMLSYVGTYFFTVAGLSEDIAFTLGLGNNGIQLIAVVSSCFLSTKVGRRTMYLSGLGVNLVCLLTVGGLACRSQTEGVLWAQGALVIVLGVSQALFVGSTTWAVVAESSSVRLRPQTVGLSRDAYYIAAISMNVLNSYMLNPGAFNWIGKSAFVWAGTVSIMIVIAYFQLPEFKDLSYRELDILFHRRVSARQFKSTVIEEGAEQ